MEQYTDNIEKLVECRWGVADHAERNELIKLMSNFYSPKWSEYVFAAERGGMAGAEEILGHRDDLLNSSSNAIAESDNTIEVKHDADWYRNQLGILAEYAANFLTD